MLADPSVPLHSLVGAGQSHLDLVEGKPFRSLLENRCLCWSAHPQDDGWGEKSQQKMQTSVVVGMNRQIFLAWDGPAVEQLGPKQGVSLLLLV